MKKAIVKAKKHQRRRRRVRAKVFGMPDKPRLSVYRSNSGLFAQVIDDAKGITLVGAGTNDQELRGKIDKTGNIEAAKKVGELLARRASEAGIKTVVFDRGGRLYHGRVKALADAARAGGISF